MSRYSVEYGRDGRFVGLSMFLDAAAAHHDRVADALERCLEEADKRAPTQLPAVSLATSKLRRKSSTLKTPERKRPSGHRELTMASLKESLQEAMALVPLDDGDDA